MSEQFPALLVTMPLLGALLVALIGLKLPKLCFPISLGFLLWVLWMAISLCQQILGGVPISYELSGWAPPWGIELRVDSLSAVVLIVIAVVAILTLIYSWQRVSEEMPGKEVAFFTLFLLLVAGLLGMTITADAFNLFVLLEVSSLTSYGLIAMGSSARGTMAAFNYIIMGTIGASFYLLGVGYLYMKTGTLNMADIYSSIEGGLQGSQTIHVAFILIILGIWIKMAFFPLYGWLPNAYTYCPSSTSCILAPLMTKVSVYMMLRMMTSVFGLGYVFNHLHWNTVVVTLAVIAIVAGSILALAQTQLKKMLCFLIIAEVGYMVGGAWLGNYNGIVGTVYHIISDALMTLCLFMAASLFFRRFHSHKFSFLKGTFRSMPLTMIAFVIGALAIIGVPPTCGFFSKWYLIRGGLEAGQYHYVIALLFSSLVNAVLFFRVFEGAYYPASVTEGSGEDAGHHGHHEHEEEVVVREEAPWSMTLPLLTCAALILALGIWQGKVVEVIDHHMGIWFMEFEAQSDALDIVSQVGLNFKRGGQASE